MSNKNQIQQNHQSMQEPLPTQTATVSATAQCQEQKEYWTILKQIAENDFQLKLVQRENEEERMEFARVLHRKNMILLDIKIKVKNLEIRAHEGMFE